MAESTIVFTPGSGDNLHAASRSYGGTTKKDQYILPAEFDWPSYTITASSVATTTAAAHLLQIMAGSSLNVRIRRITIVQGSHATNVSIGNFVLYRLSTAGTGGGAITPAKMDPADSAAGTTAMTLPSSKGTETDAMRPSRLILRQGLSTGSTQVDGILDWDYYRPNIKPLIISAGVSNGIAVKNVSAVAGATVDIYVELVETAFI